MLNGVQFLFILFFLGVQFLNSKPVFSINDISIISSIQYIMRNSKQLVVALQTQSSCSNFPSHSSLIVRGPSEEEQHEVISRLPHTHTPTRVTAISPSVHSQDREQTAGSTPGNNWTSKPGPSDFCSDAHY